MKYEIRPLCSRDIFPMSKIISKIGFSQLKSCFDSDELRELAKKNDVEGAGLSVILNISSVIISNLSNCETEIYKFLAEITGEKVEDLKEASIADFAELVVSVIRKEEFADFITVVSRLFN